MIKVKIFIIYVYLLVEAISIWYLTIRGQQFSRVLKNNDIGISNENVTQKGNSRCFKLYPSLS